jgi:hypothetical protein
MLPGSPWDKDVVFSPGTWWRDVDDGGVRVDLGLGLRHRVEDGKAKMELTPLSRWHAAHHVGSVLDGLAGVEGALLAREALADYLDTKTVLCGSKIIFFFMLISIIWLRPNLGYVFKYASLKPNFSFFFV